MDPCGIYYCEKRHALEIELEASKNDVVDLLKEIYHLRTENSVIRPRLYELQHKLAQLEHDNALLKLELLKVPPCSK